MNLIDLVSLVRKGEIIQFLKEKYPDLDFEIIDIYFEEKLDVYANLQFFEMGSLGPSNEAVVDGVKLINLWSLDYLQELMDDFDVAGAADEKVAKDLLHYRIYDA